MKPFSSCARTAGVHRRIAQLFALLAAVAFSPSAQTTRVVGWGWNIYGQTTPPAALSNAITVAGGFTYSLALRADGTVAGWGQRLFVPSGLNGIAALAAAGPSGGSHDLALRDNGTVLAWGSPCCDFGQSRVPPGLSNVVAVSAGGLHSLALKADGTAVGWGNGQTNIPPSASNLIAIAAGAYHDLAVRSDGIVVAWGGETNVPIGLSNVVAVAASRFSMALRSDGTVVVWGGTATNDPPADLTNVVAIAAGYSHSLALRSDGAVIAWGANSRGQTKVPAAVTNVTAIAAGFDHNLAVTGSTPPPWPRIIAQPRSLRKLVGNTATFSVTGSAGAPLSYRWQYRGQDLLNETNSSLVLSNLSLSVAGDYAVIVSADGLSVRSAPAFLTVSDPPVSNPVLAEGLEDTDLVIELNAFDPSGLPLVGRINSLPTAGRLFQYEDGDRRGAPIDSAPALVSSLSGLLVYAPNPDGNGTNYDRFLFSVNTELGDSAPAPVQIDIQPVNDPPAFLKGPDVIVNEDAGPQVVPGWATDIRGGPANEATQSLVFVISNDNPALFTTPPALDPSGTLMFITAPDANGKASVTVFLQDDGGAALGGTNSSDAQIFYITVLPVNDPPVAQSQSIALNEDTSIAITLRVSDIEGDGLSLLVSPPSHGTLTGTASKLTYWPAPNYFGPDVFSFKANDGQADSAAATVNIQVLPVNDPPVAAASVSSQSLFDTTNGTNFAIIAPNNSNAVVVLDGSLSTDVDNDPLEYFWFDGPAAVPFASSAHVPLLLKTGPHAMVLRVSDGVETDATALQLEVITPAEATQRIIGQVDESEISRKRKRSLTSSLKSAVKSFQRGKFKTGVRRLETFQHKVRHELAHSDQPSDRLLADALVRAAQRIVSAVEAGCETGDKDN